MRAEAVGQGIGRLQGIGGLLLMAPAGVATAAYPAAVGTLTVLALGFAVAWITWWRLDCIPTRPFDVALALTIVVVPVAPVLNAMAGLGTVLRFGCAVMLLAFVVAGGVPLARPTWSNGRWLVLAFALYQLVAFVGSGDVAYGGVRLLNWVMFIPIAFVTWDSRRLRTAVAACFSAAVLLVLGIAMQYMGTLGGTWGGFLLSGVDTAAPAYSIRYTSFFQNPNDLGLAMLSLTLAALLLAGVPGRSFAWRLSLIGGAGVMTAGFVLAGSRAALLGLPLVGLYLVAVRRSRAVLQLLAVGGLVTLAILTMSPGLRQSVAANLGSVIQIMNGEDASAMARLEVWAMRINGGGNVIIGAGYGGYSSVRASDMTQGTQRAALYAATTVDNGWLKLGLEEGIVGIALLAGILTSGLRRAVGLGRRQGSWAMGSIGGSVLVLLVFRAFSMDIFDINPWNFFIWLLVGILLSDQVHEPTTQRPDRGPFRRGLRRWESVVPKEASTHGPSCAT
jgi:hypothetical protein